MAITLKLKQKLSSKLVNGTVWTVLGYGGSTFVRMLGSLILTRIFLPEVFGLMAIISAIMVGLELLSDVGVRTSVIQHKDGESKEFLKTAWTIQVIRGFLLYVILLFIAPVAAALYVEPLLTSVLPVLGIVMVLKGLTSTSVLIYSKRLLVKKPILLELASQVLGLLATISLALYLNNIWAFIIGWIISVLFQVISSYLFFEKNIIGLRIEKHYCFDIIKYGKWILLGTVITYLVGQGDRLILGLFLTKNDLGLYNLAVMFAALATTLFAAISGKMMLPALAEVHNDDSKVHLFSHKFNQIRSTLLKLLLPILVVFSIFGDLLIELLFNDNYQAAGWMLQVLAIGGIGQVLIGSFSPVFLARGDSFGLMINNTVYGVFYLSLLILGQNFYGMQGVVIGVAIAPFLTLPIIHLLVRKHVEVSIKISILYTFISLIVIVLGWLTWGISIPTLAEFTQ